MISNLVIIKIWLNWGRIRKRKKNWVQPQLNIAKGVLYKYALTVSSAAEGCVTDE